MVQQRMRALQCFAMSEPEKPSPPLDYASRIKPPAPLMSNSQARMIASAIAMVGGGVFCVASPHDSFGGLVAVPAGIILLIELIASYRAGD